MNPKAISVISVSAFIGIAAFLLFGFPNATDTPPPRKEVLIYCGITMIQPMAEIASIIEKRDHVKISIVKGGSGDLLKSIQFNQQGDLYLPGSESYIDRARSEGLVTQSVHVGYNKAALMIRHGNPKSIDGGLESLQDPNLYVVIGSPESGSIGKETKKILTVAGIYDQVMQNARELTTDSKRLVEVIINGEADLVINWYAASTWQENTDFIDIIPIDEKYASKKQLILGLLSTSRHPDVARQIMTYAASTKGREIFNKYGLYEID